MADKTEMQKLAEKILIQKKPGLKTLDPKQVNDFAEKYKEFLSNHKTEREIVSYVKEEAENAGFTDITKATSLEKGWKYYLEEAEKNLALIRFGGLGSLHVVASHADSPCLHLKPYPLAEAQKVALLKGHYYGGIKKYQWANFQLALHGVVFTKNGKRVDINIGEKPGDPVFTVPDLLPHLARDQMQKKAKDIIEGEQLNPIVGNTEVDDENISEKAKLAIAKLLNEQYGIVEEDFITSELMFVPAGPARDVGFDKSMVSGFGQDDKSSAYTSVRAILDAKDFPGTQICLLYDKEEIGSEGKTSAKNRFLQHLIERLIELSETDMKLSQVWKNTKIISADVTCAADPNFADAHDLSNASFLGYGVSVEKYGGAGGKYYTNDAEADFMRKLLALFEKNKVPWQTGEAGKIDLGGGGTIAMYLAEWGADVIDIGIPVLGMHAPFELSSKADLYAAYKAYKTFFENQV